MTQSRSKKQPLRIAIDAMGGDYAPGEIVKGAVEAAKELEVEITLVGHTPEVEKELEDEGYEFVRKRRRTYVKVVKR